jgi:hypothetical protein
VAEVRDERWRVDGGDVAMVRFATASGMKTWAERGEACLQESIKLSDRCRTYFGIAEGMGDAYNRLLGGRHGLAPLIAQHAPMAPGMKRPGWKPCQKGKNRRGHQGLNLSGQPLPATTGEKDGKGHQGLSLSGQPLPVTPGKKMRRNRDLRKREEERSRERKSAGGKGVKGRWRK